MGPGATYTIPMKAVECKVGHALLAVVLCGLAATLVYVEILILSLGTGYLASPADLSTTIASLIWSLALVAAPTVSGIVTWRRSRSLASTLAALVIALALADAVVAEQLGTRGAAAPPHVASL
jgi:hypothetical protein